LLAWVVDAAFITVLVFAVVAASGALLGPTVHFHPDAPALRDTMTVDTGMLVLNAVLTAAVSAAYVVVPSSVLGASPGQLLWRLRVVDETDGSALSVARALKRWALVFPPFATLAAFGANAAPLATLIWGAEVAWYLVLVLTTVSSETSQGLHDRLVGDIVRSRGDAWSHRIREDGWHEGRSTRPDGVARAR
jgi:uncharacterized RDD family membrane protein YckC